MVSQTVLLLLHQCLYQWLSPSIGRLLMKTAQNLTSAYLIPLSIGNLQAYLKSKWNVSVEKQYAIGLIYLLNSFIKRMMN